MQIVLITGANGFVSSYLIPLLAPHYKVIATAKGPFRSLFNHPNVVFEELDFTEEESVKEIMNRHKPHFLVHAGALSKPDDCENNQPFALATNTTSTQHLLKYATLFKSFFLFLSTDFIFDGKSGMYKEEDEAAPVNYYGETKVLAEEAVKAYAWDWCIVRTVLVYGKALGNRHNLVTLVAEKLKKGEEYNVFTDQVRTPTYVADLAQALKTIIDKRETGIFHISGKDVLTPYQMAVATADHLQLNKSLIKPATSERFKHGAARPQKTGFDISKAERLLGFKPISFAEGLEKTFE